jgi:hypothetical protein
VPTKTTSQVFASIGRIALLLAVIGVAILFVTEPLSWGSVSIRNSSGVMIDQLDVALSGRSFHFENVAPGNAVSFSFYFVPSETRSRIVAKLHSGAILVGDVGYLMGRTDRMLDVTPELIRIMRSQN